MPSPPDPSSLSAAAEFLSARFPRLQPAATVICGSGWSSILDVLEVLDQVPYTDIPGLGPTGVTGHTGTLCRCRHQNHELLVFQGRRHLYEGVGWTPIALPVHLTRHFGAPDILLTNSAGAINPDFAPGDLMLILDHLNLMGDNPLVGPHQPNWGPRFPDQTRVYSPSALRHAAEQARIPLREGLYLATRGPVYETPAEIRAFRLLGADAVGMSTIPEAILASAAGLRVAALSCITNYAAGILDQPLSHHEVTQTASNAMPRMQTLLKTWITHLES